MAKPYHHGDLRRALIDATLEVLQEKHASQLSLRDVARRAGVSHAAPYHHFEDKGALMDAVAHEGFERMGDAFRRAVEGTDDPFERLTRLGEAYVFFFVKNPQFYDLMWCDPSSEELPLDRARGSSFTFQTLLECVRSCRRAVGLPIADPLPDALFAWSMVHGLAHLLINGQLGTSHLNDEEISALVLSRMRNLIEGADRSAV